MPTNYKTVNNLKVSEDLLAFVNKDLLDNTGITPEKFWSGFDKIVHELAPKNKVFLKIKENLQKQIDKWHIENKGQKINIFKYKRIFEKNWLFKKRRF